MQTKMLTTIRDFAKEDKDNYLALSDMFYHSGVVCCSVPQSNFEKTFEKCLERNPYVRGLMIEHDGETAGFALLSFTYSNEAGGMVVLLEEAFVLPDFRGKGIMRELFVLLEKEYKDMAARFRLEVTRDNGHAIKIYEKYGYKEIEYMNMIKDV